MQFELKRNPRRLARWIWIYFLYYTGLLRWARNRVLAANGIVVLTLHRVLEDSVLADTFSPQGMVLRRSSFEALLAFLRAHGEVLSVKECLASEKHGSKRPRFAITFDDGWKDTATVAWPLARKHDCSICVFVCPNLAGKTSPFWPERVLAALAAAAKDPRLKSRIGEVFTDASVDMPIERSAAPEPEELLNELKRLPAVERDSVVEKLGQLLAGSAQFVRSCGVDATMDWEDSLRMRKEGVEFGSHTNSHEILPAISQERAFAELKESKAAIEEKLHRECAFFAYPNGSWSPEVRGVVEETGYTVAFKNEPGIWTPQTDPLLIPRINVWEGTFCGPTLKFSPAVFQYESYWKALRATS